MHSLQPTIAYPLFSVQLGVSPRCHGLIPAALMLVVFMLVPNMTPPSFRFEASGGTITVWRRYVRQKGKIKKTGGIKSKGGRKEKKL